MTTPTMTTHPTMTQLAREIVCELLPIEGEHIASARRASNSSTRRMLLTELAAMCDRHELDTLPRQMIMGLRNTARRFGESELDTACTLVLALGDNSEPRTLVVRTLLDGMRAATQEPTP